MKSPEDLEIEITRITLLIRDLMEHLKITELQYDKVISKIETVN